MSMLKRYLVWDWGTTRKYGIAIEAESMDQAKRFYAEGGDQPLYEVSACALPAGYTETVYSAVSETGLA